jgi:hypothetical protein
MMRLEKGSPDNNAARTLMFGSVAALLILVGLDPALRLADQVLLPRPWVNPVIEIVAEAEGKPSIRYGARPQVELTGTWTTWIEVNGRRGSTTKGEGHYMPDREPRMWEWGDWFGRDWPVPLRPFVACVSYDLHTTSGARGQFGPFCSEEFTP